MEDLSLKQVRDVYAGRVTNWSRVGGNDVPIHLVSRNPGSGTRTTLERQVLDGRPLPAVTTPDCAGLDRDRPGRCEVGGTGTLLDTVASTPGALGHSEVGAAAAHDDVRQIRIDGYPATLEGADQGRIRTGRRRSPTPTANRRPTRSRRASCATSPTRWARTSSAPGATAPAPSWTSRCCAGRTVRPPRGDAPEGARGGPVRTPGTPSTPGGTPC